MKPLLNFLQFRFLPYSADAGLLALRLWLGGCMAVLHGWPKLSKHSEMAENFGDPIGIGSVPAFWLAVFAELLCSVLLVLGFLTRFAAIALGVTMGVAFFVAHKGVLSGPGSGEMAFLYLGGFVTLFLAGAGRFSVDAKL